MKKSEYPTHAQAADLRETLIELGITKKMWQEDFRDSGEFTTFLKERRDQILSERENILTFDLTATVQQNRDYIEAMEAAGPDTSSCNNARKVGDLYLPVSQETEEVNFILRHFPKGGGSWDKALAWAKANGYKLTNPREVFAVIEQHDLKKLLDRNWLYLAATTECNFVGYRQAVCVDVLGSGRGADLCWLEDFREGPDWFLFRK
jgi:hypothetical protein